MKGTAERAVVVEGEMQNVSLGDARLNYRARRVAQALAKDPDLSFPQALLKESELEGFYRLLSNKKVTCEKLLAPHIEATVERLGGRESVLIVHDNTELRFAGAGREGLGRVGRTGNGLMAHFCLAVSSDGVRDPLGIVGLKTWARTGKSATHQRKVEGKSYKEIRQQPSEQDHWFEMVERAETSIDGKTSAIHVMDSEADDYTLLWNLQKSNRRFVLRLCQDRRLDEQACGAEFEEKLKQFVLRGQSIAERQVPLSGRNKTVARGHHRTKREAPRSARLAKLSFSARVVTIRRPLYAMAEAETLTINVVTVVEKNPPADTDPVEWILLTSEPIETKEQVLAVVDVYRARWLIEEYFKALKSGCAFLKRQLESKETITNALALFVPIAWVLLRMRTLSRTSQRAGILSVLTPNQVKILRSETGIRLRADSSVETGCLAVARIGGHLKRNGAPGWQVLGRGYQRLLTLETGYRIAKKQRSDQS